MKIEKVFNNNTVATLSKDKVEMIVTGPGIGFQKKIGDELDERKVEKRYLIEDSQKDDFTRCWKKCRSSILKYRKLSSKGLGKSLREV